MFSPSRYQQAVFDFMANRGGGDLQISAVAGSGKTTTLIELLKRLPENIQEATLLCAFNKEIATELGRRAPSSTTVKTIHAVGFATLAAHFGGKGPRWNPEVSDKKYRRLIEAYWTSKLRDPFDPETEAEREMFKLVHFARVCLVDPADGEAVLNMVAERELELPEPFEMLNALRVILKWGKEGMPEADRHGCRYAPAEWIDFDDMLWLPHVLELQPRRFLLVLCDEAQDLSTAQLNLVLKSRAPRGRMVFCGDPCQAIYAFCGADSQSWQNIGRRTKAAQLPLSVCYRCPTAVIDLAKQIVPHLEAAEGAPVGVVETIKEASFSAMVTNKDMVLCRVNAPLISWCFRLIGEGRPAKVRGRDIGAQLVKLVDAVEKQQGFEWDRFGEFAETYRNHQAHNLSKMKNGEMLVASLHDRVDSVMAVYSCALSRGATSTGDIRVWIDELFADKENGYVLLSSIHRAKGLEADRVFILVPEKLPHPMAKTPAQREQEENLRYVAYTRAHRELYIVATAPKV